MNINDLTLGQAKELAELFKSSPTPTASLNSMINEMVIVRTYSAGVWFGTLREKSGNEVIIQDARRMWKWWAAESISLSACAIHGIIQEKSKICEGVPRVWLEAIEIIPCTNIAIKSITGAKNVKAQ